MESSQNHQRKEDEDQSSESQTPRNEVTEPGKPLQISDVVDNCMLDIFDRLSLVDLLNVADTNQRFKRLAEIVLIRKRYLPLHFLTFESIRPYPCRIIEMRLFAAPNGVQRRLKFKDLKSCLQLLRCFGNHIRSLHFDCKDVADKHRMRIEQYLSKFCSKTLGSLELSHVTSPQLFYGINESFATGYVVLSDCQLTDEFGGGSLPKLFPNLRTLVLKWSQGPNLVAANFPHLESLTMHYLSQSFVIDMLRLNPQLRSLEVYWKGLDEVLGGLCYCDPAFDEYINDYLPNLERLSLDYLPDYFADNIHHHKIFHFDNIIRLEVEVFNEKSPSIWFRKLRDLSVSYLYLNQKTLGSLAKMKDLKTLRVMDLIDTGNFLEQLLQLDNVLNNVQDLHIDLKNVSAECVIRFLEQSKSIEGIGYFGIGYASNDKIRKEIVSKLGDK